MLKQGGRYKYFEKKCYDGLQCQGSNLVWELTYTLGRFLNGIEIGWQLVGEQSRAVGQILDLNPLNQGRTRCWHLMTSIVQDELPNASAMSNMNKGLEIWVNYQSLWTYNVVMLQYNVVMLQYSLGVVLTGVKKVSRQWLRALMCEGMRTWSRSLMTQDGIKDFDVGTGMI